MKKTATLSSCRTTGKFTWLRSSINISLMLLFLLSGLIFTSNKLDAQQFAVDFRQAANHDSPLPLGTVHWINSILQGNNSKYVEGMSTLQRIIFTDLSNCNNGKHVLQIKMQSDKGIHHAYDFITSWSQSMTATAQIAPNQGFLPDDRNDPTLNECGPNISAGAQAACTLVTGGEFRDIPVLFDFLGGTGEGNNPLGADQNSVRQVIKNYETRYGQRSVRVYAPSGTGLTSGAAADNFVEFVKYDAGYIFYNIHWTSSASSIMIEYAAHIAVGVDGLDPNPNDNDLGVGYFKGQGAADINGGPYHTILVGFLPISPSTTACEGNMGNQDNQLQGSEILLFPKCNETGPSTACEGQTGLVYSSTNTNLADNDVTFLWEIVNSNQTTPAQITAGQGTGGPITVTAGSAGTYTVKFTITNYTKDDNPNKPETFDNNTTTSCSVNTTVSGGPTITCPNSTTTGACQTQQQVNDAYQTWLGQVSAGGVPVNPPSAPSRCGGTVTVVFRATNTCGTATCSASFTVTADNTPPGFTGNYANVTLGCNPSAGDISGALGSATATDACGNPTITNSDGTVGSDGCGRSQTRTFRATDACGNTATISRTVTWIADNTGPVFTGSYTSTTLGCNPAASDISGALGSATATDGCSTPTILAPSDGNPSTNGCLRTQTRTFTARDACGNTSTISRSVTWTADLTPPTFTGSYAAVTLGCNPLASDITGALGTATATDACSTPTLGFSDGNVGSNGCSRSQTRTFTARDACGNTATTSRTVSWTADVTPPVFTSPNTPIDLGCFTGAVNLDDQLGGATATDACGTPTVTFSDGALQSNGCARTATRTYTARDACGNTATTSRSVTFIFDPTPPTFTGDYSNITLGCNPTDIPLGSASATDACSSPSITQSDGNVQSNGCGRSQTRTFTARDGCGNTSTISRTVTWISDLTPPTFTGSYASLTLGCNPAASDITGALGTATATDACSNPTITSSDGNVNSNGCGRSQTRTFTARDACGNTATTSRTVSWISDLTPPTFTGSYASVTLGCNPAASDISNALDGATATDACSDPTITNSDGNVSSNGCGRSQTRTFTARDACGNTATISRTVSWISDLTPPTFTGSYATVTLGCNPAASDIAGALDGATATDACSDPTITNSDGNVSSNGCGRSQTRTFTARDACGNTATISRTVSWISDLTPPVFTGSYASVTLGCNPAASDISGALGSATATDGCGTPTVLAPSDGNVSSNGCSRSQTRTFTAIDACGNTSTVSRSVTWTSDLTPPTFTGSYASVTLGCNPAASDIAGALDGATATDACSDPTITNSDGNVSSNGCSRSQTRTFTARDACGNTATTSRTVSWISDLTPPVFTGSYASVTLGCNPAASDISGALGSATATDGCGTPTVLAPSDGNVSSNGCSRSQTRTFTAIDACGNTSTVSRSVTWTSDLTPPTFTGSYTSVTLGCNPAASDITGALGTATATDACSNPTITNSDGNVSSNGCGRSQTRTFTARDACGNTATTSRTVSWISDLTPPTFTGSYTSVTLGGCNPAASDISGALGSATATDGCSTPTVLAPSDGNVSSNGCVRSQTRTFTAIDACGNTATVSRTATWISDITPPTLVCVADKTVECGGGFDFDPPSATDNCGGTITPTIVGTVTNQDGGQTRTWIAQDACGNTATCSQTIHVAPCGHIFPTQTTCCNYLTGTASNLLNVCYTTSTINNGSVTNAIPGVFFYYAKVVAPAANFTIDVTQTNDGKLNKLFGVQNVQNVKLFTTNCDRVTATESVVGSSNARIVVTGATPGATYVVSIKYDVKTIIGATWAGAAPTSTYTFKTFTKVGANAPVLEAGSTGNIDAAPNCADNTPLPGDCTLPTTPARMIQTAPVTEVTTNNLSVSAYPNPFTDKVNFVIKSNVSGQGTLEIYNMLGQKIQTVYNGNIVAERSQTVEYTPSRSVNGGLIYIFRVGNKQATGKLLKLN